MPRPHRVPDVQIFLSNGCEVLYQPEREFVLKLVPLVPNTLVNLFEQPHRFAAAVGAFLATSNLTLSTAQFRFGLLVPAAVRHRLTVRQRGERFQPNINTDFLPVGGQRLRFALSGETGVPLAALSLDGNGFNFAANRAIQFDFDLPDALNAKPIVVQLDAVPVTRERDAVETAARLESRITGLLALLHPAKERLVCFVHTAKDVLAAGEIRQPQVPSSTNLFRLIRLRVVVDRNSLLPRIATFLQCGVVQTACFTQLHIQQFAFEAGRE